MQLKFCEYLSQPLGKTIEQILKGYKKVALSHDIDASLNS